VKYTLSCEGVINHYHQLWKKLTAFALAFFISLGSIYPAFAEELNAPIESILVQENASSEAVTEDPMVTVEPPLGQESTVDSQPEISELEDAEKEPESPAADILADPNPIKEGELEKKDDEAEALAAGQEVANVNNMPPSTIRQILPETDKVSGALNYEYPLAIPQGRNGIQPDLKLTYNSQTGEDGTPFGYGWSANIPYIERINKKGSNQLYSTTTPTYFLSSLDAELATTTATSTYVSRVDNGSFNSYTFSNNQWLVKDKKGHQLKFGYSAATRQDHPTDSSKVYKWMLEEVRDANDNYIKYEYYKDQGQIYPSKIKYTGFGAADGIFEIEFLRESRSDTFSTFKAAFLIKTVYRINEIQAKISGSWVRKYALTYGAGSNNYRSLLSSITESGKDELDNIVSLPAVQLQYTQNTPTWNSSGWSWNGAAEQYVRLTDANGDSYPDFMYNYDNNGYPEAQASSTEVNNTTNTWSNLGTPPGPAIALHKYQNCGGSNGFQDQGVLSEDINGDFLTDLVQKLRYEDGSGNPLYLTDAYLNSAGQTWAQSLGWVPTLILNKLCFSGAYSSMADFNGDGLVDIYRDQDSQNFGLQLNTGTGFSATTTSWAPPGGNTNNQNGRLVDVNRDGLVDNLQSYSGPDTKASYLNNGTGAWTASSTWDTPIHFFSGSTDNGVKFADINADGLVDVVQISPNAPNNVTTYLNTGNGWQERNDWEPENPGTWSVNTRLLDINGDSLVDFITFGGGGGVFYTASGTIPDLLSKVTYPEGGFSQITYKVSAKYRNEPYLSNPSLPVNFVTVSEITNNDGLGTTSTNTFKYEGGLYYFGSAQDRKFAGFSAVTQADTAGNTASYFYHQANASNSSQGEFQDNYWKIGKPYRIEQYDNGSNLFKKTINKWEAATSTPVAGFVKLTQTVESTYDGDSSHKDKAESYTYNNNTGNLTQKIEWGEATGSDDGTFSDTGSDKFTTDFTYATSATSSILSLLNHTTVTDQSANKVKEDKFYYDNLSFGIADKGNLTKKEMWKTSSTYIDIEKTYNSYGLVTQEKDPRDKTTTYSYDSNNLYPATVTNPASHVSQYTYDYSLGKPKQTTDPNGNIFQNTYDGLDRVLEQKQPDPSATSSLLTALAFTYTDSSGNVNVKQSKYLDGSTTADSYIYLDGLGRKKQERKEAESGNYSVKDYAYNNIGLLQKESLPYFSVDTASTTATSTAALFINYSYDALHRVATTTNAVGTTTNAYLDWKLTVTDPRGKTKSLYNDAFAQLIKVEENNSTGTYTTLYEYNGNGNLTKITDALSNIRNFTYDGLGRRLTAQDLHASSDGTYGSYAYTYDDANNLTQKVDPKSQTINYTYDDLNRQLTEDYTGTGGTEVIYTYDTCTQGKGRLCTASSTALTMTNAYNALGQLTVSTSTISSTAYPTSHTYDRQGNQLTIANPDSSQAVYSYNSAGLLETVAQKNTSTSTPDSIVANFNYSPTEQITLIAYGNNATTTNTYDPSKLYRLTAKATATASSSPQSFAYTYDANGNVTQIVDNSNTHSAKTVNYVYDDLNRLTSASSTAATYGGNYLYSYAYDALGNILSRTENASTTTYSYATSTAAYLNPHAVSTTTAASITGFTYDNNGNLTATKVGTSTLASYTWDYNNRLTQGVISGTPTTTVTSTYDSSGQRISYSVTSGTSTPITTYYPSKFYNIDSLGNATRHIFAGNMMLSTVTYTPHIISGNNPACTPPSSGDWTISTSCIFTGSALAPQSVTVNAGKLLTISAGSKLLIDFKHYKLLVKKTGGVLIKKTATLRQVKASDTGTNIYYQHTDHLTGQGITTNADGSVVELMDYYPYGTARLDEKTGTLTEQRKFANYEFDSPTGLNYLNQRYYNSQTAKFLSQDQVFLAMGDNGQIQQLTRQKLQQLLSDPQALNSYAYARNNPLLYVDRDGNFWSPFNGVNGQWFVSIGNWANNKAQNNSAFNYVTSHPGLAYAVGGVGIAAGGAAGVLYGLGAAGVSTLGGTCVAFCNQASRQAQVIGQAPSVRDQLLNSTSDSKLKNIINELYRQNPNAVGDGGTADALRYETQTGNLLSKSGHLEKATGRITELTRYLGRDNLAAQDRQTAQSLLNNLKDAVKTATDAKK